MDDKEIREFTKETLRKQMVLLAERSTVVANSVEELCALTNCMTNLVNPLSWYFPETLEKETPQ